jgi:V-type H+-transporting ATPase subunit C
MEASVDSWRQYQSVDSEHIHAYLETFNWNTMKYRSDKTLKELVDSIQQEVNSIDTVMKSKLQAYTTTKNSLITVARKTT